MKIKKLISILCCAAMLIGLLPATVFAAAPGVYDLAGYGQQMVTLPAKQTMPTVNGKIEANEYAWSYTVSLTEDDPDDGVRIENASGVDTSEATEITYHMSSDSENVYFGITLVDTTYRSAEFFYLSLDAGNDYSKHLRYYIPIGKNNAEVLNKPAGTTNKDFYVSNACYGQTVNGVNQYHSEIQISRAQLEAHFGIENLDTLLVSMTQRYVYNNGSAMATWGIFSYDIQKAGLAPTTTMNGGTYIYPHVVNLADTWVPSAFEVAEYGQVTATIPAQKDMPKVNGTIADDEYAWSYIADISSGSAGDQAFITDTNNVNNGETTQVTYYMSSDSNYVYFAVATKDTAYRSAEYLYLQIDATSDLSKQMRYYVPIGSQNAELLNKPSGTNNADYYEENASSYKVDSAGNTIGYHTEIKISRKTLEEYFGVEDLDTILVSMSQRCTYISGQGSANVTWGFYSVPLMNAGLKVPGTMNGAAPYAYPHVVKLAESYVDLSDPYNYGALGQQTADIPQSATTPNPNGTITAGEYAWSYEADFSKDATDDNFFLTGTDVTDADKATKVTYYMSSDSDKVYFAVDLDDTKAEGNDALYLQITAGDDLSKFVQYYVKIGGIEMPYNTLGLDKANIANYFKDTGSTYTITNGVRVGSQFEVSIGRDQLKTMFGVDSLDKLLVTMTQRYQYSSTEGTAYAVWGFRNDKLTEAGVPTHSAGTAYPHAVNLADSLIIVTKDPYDLAEFGQKTETLTQPYTPFIDGAIDEGEYEIEIDAMLADDATNDNFFVYGDTSVTNAEGVKLYMAADEENLYFAAEQFDDTRVGGHDALYLQIGTEATNSFIQIYFTYSQALEILSEKDKTLWSSYYDLYQARIDGDKTYYEISIPRSILKTKFGTDNPEKLLVSLAHRVHANSNVVITWGFQSDKIGSAHTAQGFPVYGYPNVLELYDVEDVVLPELPEEPVECDTHDFDAWVVDGAVATRACGVCSFVESSADYSYSGTCGEGLVWFIDKVTATLTVVGEGAMADYTFENDAPWYAYRANIGAVVVAEGVTSVGDYAFWSKYPIKNVTLASTVKSIGENAFSGAKIETIELPEGLEFIGALTFQNTALTEINIPASVVSVGTNPFVHCDALESITVDEGNTAYKTSGNCLVKIDGEEIIASANDAVIADDVNAIGRLAFAASDVTTLNIPASVSSIDATAFVGSALTAITVDEASETYKVEGNCLIDTRTNTVVKGFADSDIPEGVLAIGNLAFAGTAIDTVILPSTIKAIGIGAFTECELLDSVSYNGTEAEWEEVTKGVDFALDVTFLGCAHENKTTTETDRVEADCETAGSYVEVVTCDKCGKELSRETKTIEALEHDYSVFVSSTAGNCQTVGTTTYKCSRCDSTDVVEGSIGGHTPAVAVIENNVPATCGTPGSYDSVVKCSICGEEISRTTVPVTATGAHSYDAQSYSNVTDDTHTKTCSVCSTPVTESHSYVDGACACGKTEACEHDYDTDVTEPTCTAKGYTTYTCTKCGDRYEDNVTDMAPHTEEIIPATPATCTKNGRTEGVKCSVCKMVLTAQQVVKKLGHTYTTATDVGDGLHKFTCSVCSTTRNDRHNFADDASICTECGAEKEHVFDGKRHEYVGAPVTEAPTLTGDTFDGTKYTAKVEDVKWDTLGGEDQAIYAAYDAEMLYIAVELDKTAYDALDFAIKVVASDNAEFSIAKDTLGAAGSKVYVDGDKVTVALNISRSALALIDIASTGNNSDDLYLVFVTLGGEEKELLIDTKVESGAGVTVEDEGDTAIDIFGTYVELDADEVISVALTWEVPTFTYTANYKWNSDDLVNEFDAQSSGWSEEPATITVVNRSNQAVTASFAFTDTIDSSELVGKFTESNDVAAVGITSVVLDSAETNHEAVTDTVYFYIIDGELPEDHVTGDTIGNITITIGTNG